jgi:hypothetical protein
MPNSYLNPRLDVELDFKGYHIVLSGDGIGYSVQAKGIILGYLAHLFEAEDVI